MPLTYEVSLVEGEELEDRDRENKGKYEKAKTSKTMLVHDDWKTRPRSKKTHEFPLLLLCPDTPTHDVMMRVGEKKREEERT